MLPFVIDRHSRISLTDQVAGGLRRTIQSGHFGQGDTLPTIDQTAQALGVSTNVVQTAIKRLSREGVVSARPKRGIEVCPAGYEPWLAHVVYLHWGSANSYYEAVSSEALVRHLLAKRILVTPVHLNANEAATGYLMVKSVLRSGPVQMAVIAGDAQGIGLLLAESDIPFVHFGGNVASASRLARRVLLLDTAPVVAQVVQHCQACRIRRLLTVDCHGTAASVSKRAADAGLDVQEIEARLPEGVGLPEAMERAGLNVMEQFLASGASLPDAIYFADDYLARGGLTALLACGIHVPEQVQVITAANRGLGPVFPKPLTRVEMDPIRLGGALAELVVGALRAPGRKAKAPALLVPEFIEGETTRRAGGRAEHAATASVG